MPVAAAIPAALSLGGAAASAFGGSGKGGPTSQDKKATTGSSSSTSSTNQTGTSTPNLNPLMSGFQSSLVPALAGMFATAQKPVYGDAQIAQVANQSNNAAKGASDAATDRLARSGSLNSGVNASVQSDIGQKNLSNITNFESQVPFLNQQNEANQTQNVMGLAEGLTGKALSSNTTSATGSGTQSGSNTGTSLDQGFGPAFGSSMANSIGGGLSDAGGKMGSGGGGKGGGANLLPMTAFMPSVNNIGL